MLLLMLMLILILMCPSQLLFTALFCTALHTFIFNLRQSAARLRSMKFCFTLPAGLRHTGIALIIVLHNILIIVARPQCIFDGGRGCVAVAAAAMLWPVVQVSVPLLPYELHGNPFVLCLRAGARIGVLYDHLFVCLFARLS